MSGEPAASGDGCFVMDRGGGITALGRDGKRLWSINLKAAAVGKPLVQDQTVWFLTADGNLHVRARADGGELDRISLGILPDGGLLQLGKQVLVSAGRGTIRPVRPHCAPAVRRELSDRKAGSVKRLACIYRLDTALGPLLLRSQPRRSMLSASARTATRQDDRRPAPGGSVRSRHA